MRNISLPASTRCATASSCAELNATRPGKRRASESKNDRNDAELLARFAAHDPKLLSPVQHRSLERQQDLNLIQARWQEHVP